MQIGMLNLPWEDVIMTCILPQLSQKDYFSLRCVSTDFKLLIEQYFKFYIKHIEITSDHDLLLTFKILTEEACRLKSIVLHNCKWLTSDLLKPVIERNHSSIQHIDLTGCSAVKSDFLLHLANKNICLKTLILKECFWVSIGAVTTLSFRLKSLECLDLSSCWEINDDSLCRLIYCNTE